jgi:hypothetical protein
MIMLNPNIFIQNIVRTLPDPEAAKLFFQLLHELIEKLNITKDDPRFSVNFRKGHNGISVNINSRLVLGLWKSSRKPMFLFMVPYEDIKNWKSIYDVSQSDKFIKNGPKAIVGSIYYDDLKNGLDQERKQKWLNCCSDFLPFEKASPVRKYNVPELFELGKEPSRLPFVLSQAQVNPQMALISEYKKILEEKGFKDELYKWELVKKFYGRPNVNAEDFTKEIKTLDFSNLIYYNARAVLNTLADKEPERLRQSFKDIYNEDVPLIDLIKGFSQNTLELYRKYEKKLSHHQDERSIASYLTYHNPEKYVFFKSTFYKKYCELLGIEALAAGLKYNHYLLELNKFIEKYIKTDQELLETVNRLLPKDVYSDSNHLILAQDILYRTLDTDLLQSENDQTGEEFLDLTDVQTRLPFPKVKSPLNTILYGPPGTGKTYHTIDKAISIAKPDFDFQNSGRESIKQEFERLIDKKQVIFITFHQSMCYEDFIEGIKPVEPDQAGFMHYEVKDGIFKQLCNEAARPENKSKNYVLIIDEISRGNVSQVFGELISLIEDDKRIGTPEALISMLPYSKTQFAVLPNVYIIGTMNTADRSVEALDTALRRRFVFEEMMPDYKHPKIGVAGHIDLQQLLKTINIRLQKLLTRDHQVGHTYFIGISTVEELKQQFEFKIIPLLQEYFYNNYSKIGWVLGEGFFEQNTEDKIRFASFKFSDDNGMEDFETKPILKFRRSAEWTEEDFIRVYNPSYTKEVEEARKTPEIQVQNA